MSDSDDFRLSLLPIIFSVRSRENQIKESAFLIFQVATKGICTQISNLNHAGQFAVNEKGSLHNVPHVRPESSISVEFFH